MKLTGIEHMKARLGLVESNPADRKILMDFFKKYAVNGDIVVDPQTTPWCACMVGACERAAGNKGTGAQNARSYLNYGTRVNIEDARQGDIAVFKRGDSTWMGHVTYIDAVKVGGLICMGGNQNNSICRQFYPYANLLGIRRA